MSRSLALVTTILALVTKSQAAFDCKLLEGKEGGNRIPLLFLAEGYTDADHPKFDSLVQYTTAKLFATSPYRELRNYFTVYAGWTPSRVSGSGFNPDSTFFHSRAGLYGMTIPAPVAIMAYSDTSLRCRDRSLDFLLNAQSVILMQGASGVFGRAYLGRNTVIIGDYLPNITVPHELGHEIGGLWDEYELKTGTSGFTATGEPLYPIKNVVATLNLDSVPWKYWISPSTPIPTPKTQEFDTIVGLFEGADYTPKGRYRPQQSCRMRSSASYQELPFCKVCRELLTAAILNQNIPQNPTNHRLRYDSVSPPVGTVVTHGEILLRTIPLDTFPLVVQWKLNGVALSGVTKSVDVDKLTGSGQLEAIVAGTTGFIRNPAYIPRDTLRWTVRTTAGTLAKSAQPKIRRMGPGMFLVPHDVALPTFASRANGTQVPLRVVAQTANGWLVGSSLGGGEVLFLEAGAKPNPK